MRVYHYSEFSVLPDKETMTTTTTMMLRPVRKTRMRTRRWTQTRTRDLRQIPELMTMSLIWPTTTMKVRFAFYKIVLGYNRILFSLPDGAPLMGIGDVAVIDDDENLEDDESEW